MTVITANGRFRMHLDLKVAKSTGLQIPDKRDPSATSGAILTSYWSRLLIPARAMADSGS
jgi:hypothetical protein